MTLPAVITIVAVSLWTLAVVTVLRPVVRGWRVNRRNKQR